MKLDPTLQWVGTFFTLLGAVLTSSAIDPWNIWAFNLGTMFWGAYAYRAKMASLFTVNIGLMVIYMGGIVRSILA